MASQLQTIQMSGAGVDLSPRFTANGSVIASPATAAETVVATIPAIQSAVVQGSGVWIQAQVAFKVGTSGTTVQYRIRQGTTAGSGTVVFDSGACSAGITAAALQVQTLSAFDSAATLPGQSYCLTVTVAGASAASTVTAVAMSALIV